jgi:hypothetical protein
MATYKLIETVYGRLAGGAASIGIHFYPTNLHRPSVEVYSGRVRTSAATALESSPT